MTFNQEVRILQEDEWQRIRRLWYRSTYLQPKERREALIRVLARRDMPVNGRHYKQVKDDEALQWLIKKGKVKIVKRQHEGILASKGTHQQWAVLVKERA